MQWRKHPILQPPSDDEVALMEPDDLIELHRIYHEAIENAEKDPFRYGFRLPHWEKAEEQLAQVSEVLALGGNRCLAPEQEIYDPVLKRSKRVDELGFNFHVHAWDGEKVVIAKAQPSFRKDKKEIYEVILDNGESFRCSKSHLVLHKLGWMPVGDIKLNDELSSPFCACHPQSSSERNPLESPQDGGHCSQTVQDSQCDYRLSLRSCGEQLPCGSNTDQDVSPSLDDAQGYSACACERSGGLGNKAQCIRPCSQSCHLSIRDVLRRFVALSADIVSRAFCKPCKLTSRSLVDLAPLPAFPRYSLESILQQSKGVFDLLGKLLSCASAYRHPIYSRRVVKINYLREDYVWDFHVPVYNNYIVAGVPHHNSGKTAWGSYCVVKAAIENPKSEIFCFAQTSEVSIRQQQSAVWNWLPHEMRTKQTSANAYISYTKKNGFTDNSLILPNASQIIFKTYSQYQNNPTILEGAELGSRDPQWHNIGVWLDEYLLGNELIDTLRFRLATRNSKMLVTFTPIDGWTEVIKEYLDGATSVQSVEAELLNGELVPYVQRSKKRNASVHYFHSKDNPFGGYERIKETLVGRPREEILIRAYGVPVKSHATKFPKFNKEVNVVQPSEIPTTNVTRYQIIDPAGAKNWFMAWIAVDASGTFWVYREWPGVDVGDWAEWKGGKWMPGQGAKGQGFGIRDYMDLIAELEGDEKIFERLIDPRLGAAKYQSADGASSIIEDLNDAGMVCIPAPGLDIDDGLQALIGKMSWDTTRPADSVNRPHFYVSSECENIIQALSEYTGDGGLKEAWKDPVDVLRYAAIAGIDHVDETRNLATRQGAGGY
jgi:hypothetical protein